MEPDHIARYCTLRRTLLFLDATKCTAAALTRLGHQVDLSRVSAGEVVWCNNTMRLANLLGFNVIATGSFQLFEECVLTGQAHKVQHIYFVHAKWEYLAGTDKVGEAFRVRPPFREECLVKMNMWGTDKPDTLWPGALKYYLSMNPNDVNTCSLIPRPHGCPVHTGWKPVPLPPYGVVFGKFERMPPKVNNTLAFAHNASFWQALRQRAHIVVVSCSDALADKLQWGPDYRSQFTCWNESPLSHNISYQNLLMNAAFLLGIGAVNESPTPVLATYCRTPVVMPTRQHSVMAKHGRPGEYYPVKTGDDVLAAVDVVLSKCKADFEPVAGGGNSSSGRSVAAVLNLDAEGTGSSSSGGSSSSSNSKSSTVGALVSTGGDGSVAVVSKSNTCFSDPPALDGVYSDEIVERQLNDMLEARSADCSREEAEQGAGSRQLAGGM